MTRKDWLVGVERRSEAIERIESAAADLVAERGFDAFSIQALSAKVHCSPATIYRNVGGKAVILERVIHLMSGRVVADVKRAISGLAGGERIIVAILTALDRLRAEPLGTHMMSAARPDHDGGWLTGSPLVAELAERMMGRHDPLAAQWLIRATFALWCWPVREGDDERAIVARFIGPAFDYGR